MPFRAGTIATSVMRWLVAAMIVSAAFDKTGLPIAGVSVSVYKVLFLAICAAYALGWSRWGESPARVLDARLLRWLVILVVAETLASIAGALHYAGRVRWSSEAYYLIQRSSVVVLPWLAAQFGHSPRRVRQLFIGGVMCHLAVAALYFVAPSLHAALVAAVADPLRPDNATLLIQLPPRTLDFIGLQRTGNYGAFAAAFGLLSFPGMFSGRRVWRVLALLCVAGAIFIALTAGSRSVLIMMAVALVVIAFAAPLVVMRRTALAVLVAVPVLALVGVSFPSVTAFVSRDRAGSNAGKIEIAHLAGKLVTGQTTAARPGAAAAIAPSRAWSMAAAATVGYGQQPFGELTRALGNDLPSMAQSHSQVLSVLLASGLIGLMSAFVTFLLVAYALWTRRDVERVVVLAVFVGLSVYNIVYDAGGLDVFACFNGIAAYYALAVTARSTPEAVHGVVAA